MDGDPAVAPELDSFSLSFPLPYRVGFIITLGECRNESRYWRNCWSLEASELTNLLAALRSGLGLGRQSSLSQ
jgi:hypothetical protein